MTTSDSGGSDPAELTAALDALAQLPAITQEIAQQLEAFNTERMSAAVRADTAEAIAASEEMFAAMGRDLPVSLGKGCVSIRLSGDSRSIAVRLNLRRLTSASIARCEADLRQGLTEALRRQADQRRDAVTRRAGEHTVQAEDLPEVTDPAMLLGEATGRVVGDEIRAGVGEGEDHRRTVRIRLSGSGEVEVAMTARARHARSPRELAECVEEAWAQAATELAAEVEATVAAVVLAVDGEEPPD